MGRKRHGVEQIIAKLREAEVESKCHLPGTRKRPIEVTIRLKKK